jgi:hypothetical protein
VLIWTKSMSLCTICLLLGMASQAAGQTADELAKQTQNPVASLISVPFQGNWDFGLGDQDETATLLNLRVSMPLLSQPGSSDARLDGLRDVVTTVDDFTGRSGLASDRVRYGSPGARFRNGQTVTRFPGLDA